MRVLRFVRDYWYVALLALGAVFLWTFRRNSDPFGAVKAEIEAVGAAQVAREAKINLGSEQAKQQVLAKYAEKRKVLDEQTEKRMQELENDDVEVLARALERATRG